MIVQVRKMGAGNREINKSLFFYVINEIVVISKNPRIIWLTNSSDLTSLCKERCRTAARNRCNLCVSGERGKWEERRTVSGQTTKKSQHCEVLKNWSIRRTTERENKLLRVKQVLKVGRWEKKKTFWNLNVEWEVKQSRVLFCHSLLTAFLPTTWARWRPGRPQPGLVSHEDACGHAGGQCPYSEWRWYICSNKYIVLFQLNHLV